jgi:tRNA(Ile)-lysidine synthase
MLATSKLRRVCLPELGEWYFVHRFESQLAATLAPHDWNSVTALVAVSGGADSVALLRGLCAVRQADSGRLIVVHYQHGLRGEEAERDAAFVEQLAAALALPVQLGRAPAGQLAVAGDSVERAAREARYRYFEEVANRNGARYLFLAHTSDDQAETVLHRILRGTGNAGLAGIPAVRRLSDTTTIVRPLLERRRAAVLAYLSDLAQPYCEDSTNNDLHYTRNRLRHDLLPKLAAEYNPQVMDALLQLATLAGEAESIVGERADEVLCAALVSQSAHEIVLDKTALARHSPALVRAALLHLWRKQDWPLQQMSFAKWRHLATLAVQAGDGSLTLPGAIRAQKQGEQLVLTRPE